MVTIQKIRPGMIHAGKTVTVTAADGQLWLVIGGETAAVVFRASGRDIRARPVSCNAAEVLSARAVLGHDDPMQPNLARISADGDACAQAILQRAQGTISQQFLDTLDERDCLALGRYGIRQSTVALRKNSATLLRDALLAAVLGRLGRQGDPRDVMVSLALHHVVAKKLGVAPPDLFNQIAGRLPGGPMPELLRVFGARQDVTLEAFGWQLIQTPEGPDFIPT